MKMKEKQKVLSEDYLFLWRVMSLQHSLILSSTNPVGIWRKEDGADFEIGYPGMYYDCCGDEEKAVSVMKERIRLAESDIREHFKIHKSCLDNFLNMDGAIIIDDREDFADSISSVCENTLSYINLVKNHKQRLGSKSFLFYLFCIPGHYFHILNFERVAPCSFNEERSYKGAVDDLEKISEIIVDFKVRPEKIPYINLPLNEQDGAGLLLPDFRKHLVTNKLLLERAGLTLSEK